MASPPESRDGDVAPPPLDLSHHWSQVANHRTMSSMKRFYKYFQIPGVANLAAGLPNVSYFPYDTLEAQVAKPERWNPSPDEADGELVSKMAGAKIADPAAAALHITVDKVMPQPNPLKKIDLATALQYGTAAGYPPLLSFVRQFTRENLHPDVPYAGGPEVILTCGSTDGFNKVVDLIVDPWFPETDPVEDQPAMLCEVFAYGNALANVKPKGVRVVPVEIDLEGMVASGPGGLQDVLENWDLSTGRRPHFMYSVTMGHNPTGSVLTVKRRKEIYALCCKYDIIIVEDDPYWYLQFPSAAELEARSRGLASPRSVEKFKPTKSSGYDFLDSLTPSFLSMDTEGRVARLDTFSKTVAPGCRLGWVTAQPAVIERLGRATETSTQQPSGFVQSLIAELIMGPQADATARFRSLSRKEQLNYSGWKADGWVRWLAGLRGEYEDRMNRMCTILDEGAYQLKQSTPVREADADWGVITKTQLLSFDWPRGGMFIWLRVHFENHPLWQATGQSIPLLDGPALSKGFFIFCIRKPYTALAALGVMFAANEDIARERAWSYYRLCFAAESQENIDVGTRRLTTAVQKFWRIKDVAEMEELINELDVASTEDTEDMINFGSPMGC